MIFLLILIKLFKKSAIDEIFEYPEEDINNNTQGVGLAEVVAEERSEVNNPPSYKQNDFLKNVIDNIEGRLDEHRQNILNFLASIWNDHYDFFVDNIHTNKVLIISRDDTLKLNIEHYQSFSIDRLSEIEMKINKNNSPLREFLLLDKKLYLKGDLHLVGDLKIFFDDYELDKYKHLFYFPIHVDKKIVGYMIFFIHKDHSPPLQEQLQKIIEYTSF